MTKISLHLTSQNSEFFWITAQRNILLHCLCEHVQCIGYCLLYVVGRESILLKIIYIFGVLPPFCFVYCHLSFRFTKAARKGLGCCFLVLGPHTLFRILLAGSHQFVSPFSKSTLSLHTHPSLSLSLHPALPHATQPALAYIQNTNRCSPCRSPGVYPFVPHTREPPRTV